MRLTAVNVRWIFLNKYTDAPKLVDFIPIAVAHCPPLAEPVPLVIELGVDELPEPLRAGSVLPFQKPWTLSCYTSR